MFVALCNICTQISGTHTVASLLLPFRHRHNKYISSGLSIAVAAIHRPGTPRRRGVEKPEGPSALQSTTENQQPHTKNTKAQEEICFIVRREAEKVFSYPSEQATDPGSSTISTSATHTPTPSLPTTQTQVTSSPHIHQSPLHHSPMITPPPLSPPRHTFSTSQRPVRSSVRIRNQHRSQSQS